MIRDYFDERAVVTHGGRRYVVRKPTCETVARFTSLFALEIQALITTWRQHKSLGHDPLAVSMAAFTDTERLATVASACVELVGGAPGEMEENVARDKELAGKLLRAAVTTCDPERLIEFSGLLDEPDTTKIPAGAPRSSKATSFEIMIVILAERYGLTPFDVMRWPYEASCSLFGDVMPALRRLMEGKPLEAGDPGEQPGVNLGALGSGGVGYTVTH